DLEEAQIRHCRSSPDNLTRPSPFAGRTVAGPTNGDILLRGRLDASSVLEILKPPPAVGQCACCERALLGDGLVFTPESAFETLRLQCGARLQRREEPEVHVHWLE